MYKITVFALLVSLTLAQEQPWNGPFANHVLGQLVPETPEVAAAKLQHARAHSEIRAVLPPLPEEEIFPEKYSRASNPQVPQQTFPQVPQQHHQHVFPQVPQQQHQVFPQIPHQQHFQPQQNFGFEHQQLVTPPQKLAEEIPRSIIGEVPEVDAARQAHLKAFNAIRAALPVLRDESTTFRSFAPQPQAFVPNFGQLPADTPEVAAAKAEHARALAAALGRR